MGTYFYPQINRQKTEDKLIFFLQFTGTLLPVLYNFTGTINRTHYAIISKNDLFIMNQSVNSKD